MTTSKTLEGPYEFYPERLTSKEMELEDVYAFSYGDKEGGLLWKSDDGFNFQVKETQRAFESLVSYVGEEALDGANKYRGSLKGQLE